MKWMIVLLVLCASPAFADIEDESDRCSYNRVEYPEGAELCQNGNLVRCEDGAWSDIGDCQGDSAEDPNSDGGDLER